MQNAKRGYFRNAIVGSCCLLPWICMAQPDTDMDSIVPQVECERPGTWKFTTQMLERASCVQEFSVALSSESPATPPEFSVSFSVPQNGMHHVWAAQRRREGASGIRADWEEPYRSSLAFSVPLVCAKDCADTNRMTVAASETFRDLSYAMRLREEGCLVKVDFRFFVTPEANRSDYIVKLLIDRRRVFWGDAVRNAVAWMRKEAGCITPSVPDTAFAPLYSTWYQFHQDLTAERIETEAKIAASLGMKTIIVDDGWQTDDMSRGYAYCGDWEVSKRRFPNMATHVKRVQELGMKYMLWYAVPFVGIRSRNFTRFKGKYLYESKRFGAGVLDPRFPDVRAFLVSTYEKAQREWGLDGFKLDFIDRFRIEGKDPAIEENYDGRDIHTVPEAVNALLGEIAHRLKSHNPNVLIEFRQSYIGPTIAQYGNMLRVGDCPGDRHANRVGIADLRLTSGNVAVHADMIEWNPETDVEEAAGSVISAIFGTVQYSMMLSELPQDHLRMIAHWARFGKTHCEALQRGAFSGYMPEAGYPIISGEDQKERIIGVYANDMVINIGGAEKPVFVLNGTGSETVVAEFSADAYVEVFDTFGAMIRKTCCRRGIGRINVPRAGYMKIVRLEGAGNREGLRQ